MRDKVNNHSRVKDDSIPSRKEVVVERNWERLKITCAAVRGRLRKRGSHHPEK